MLIDMMASQTFIKAKNNVKVDVDENRINKGYEQGKEVVRKYDWRYTWAKINKLSKSPDR